MNGVFLPGLSWKGLSWKEQAFQDMLRVGMTGEYPRAWFPIVLVLSFCSGQA